MDGIFIIWSHPEMRQIQDSLAHREKDWPLAQAKSRVNVELCVHDAVQEHQLSSPIPNLGDWLCREGEFYKAHALPQEPR